MLVEGGGEVVHFLLLLQGVVIGSGKKKKSSCLLCNLQSASIQDLKQLPCQLSETKCCSSVPFIEAFCVSVLGANVGPGQK